MSKGLLARILCTVVCAAVSPVTLPAASAELLLDVNPVIIPRGSTPNNWVRLGERVLFNTGTYDQISLWRTDGTSLGTVRFLPADGMVRAFSGDTVNGRALFYVWQIGGDSFLASTDGTTAGTQTLFQFSTQGGLGEMRVLGRTASDRLLIWSRHPQLGLRVWTTDGTTAGTTSIPVTFGLDTRAFPNEVPPVVRGDRVFFGTYDEQNGPTGVWQTDGTLANTRQVTDSDPTPTSSNNPDELLGADADHIYFQANNPGTTGRETWRYSLATDTAQLLVDFAPGHFDSYVYWLQPVAGGVVVYEQDSVWFINTAGTVTTHLMDFTSTAELIGRVGDHVLVRGYRSIGGAYELWSLDGTATGTVQLHDFSANSEGSGFGSLGPTLSSSRALIYAHVDGQLQIWSTDGTPAGTHRIQPGGNVVFGNDPLFFVFAPEFPGELWKIDRATEGVTSIPLPARGSYFTGVGQLATFNGTTDVTGTEPWITDGTVTGSRMLVDIEPQTANDSSYLDDLTTVGNLAMFKAYDAAHGFELWKTDGTAAGTNRVIDVLPGPPGAGVGLPTASGGNLYFQNLDTIGSGLWRSDGTAAGSAAVRDNVPTQFQFDTNCREWLAPLGAMTLFITRTDTSGIQLWATDGTTAGTRLVNVAVHGSNSGAPMCGLQTHGSLAYYRQRDASGRQRLFRSDGTAAGTFRLTGDSAATLTGTVGELYSVGTRVYFVLDDLGTPRLWSTDGSVNGTVPFTASGDATGLPLAYIVGVLDGALIVARHQNQGPRLSIERLNVTTGGLTALMADVLLAGGGVATGGRLFFQCEGLCVTSGDAAGTSRILQQDSSTNLPTVGELMAYNGAVYFRSRPSITTGEELWKSDGTAAGTVRITPAASGTSIEITQPAIAGGRVVFGMSQPDIGRELWRVTSAPPTTGADAVSVISGNSVILSPLANDADSDGRLVAEGLAITVVPTNGTATLQANGTVRYTPNGGFSGTDTFRYRVTDDTGNVSAETTATVTVTAQPAPPSSRRSGGGRIDALLLAVLAGWTLLAAITRRRDIPARPNTPSRPAR